MGKLKVPIQHPFHLFMNVFWGEGKVLGSEEGKAIGSELFCGYAIGRRR
jgi:hypothetical protein